MLASISNFRTMTKLVIGFACILIVGVVVNVVSLLSSETQKQATFWTAHTYKVLLAVDQMVAGMVNQETGVRGYLLAGDGRFLDPQKAGAAQFQRAFNEVKSLTSDNPVQQNRLADLEAVVREWSDQVSSQEIALMSDKRTWERARAMEISGAGKNYMDKIRGIAKAIADSEASLLEERTAASTAAADKTFWTIMIGLGLTVSFTAAVLALLSTTMIRPIRRITESMRVLARGDTGSVIPFAERKDEVGEMASAVEVFRQNAINNARLEQEAVANRSASEANRAAEQQRIAREAEQLRHATTSLGEALTRLASGDLTCRLNAAFSQEYEGLRADFNATVDQLSTTVGAVSVAVQNMESGTREIAAGANDLSKRTEQQAASLEETAAALDQITSNVSSSSKMTAEARGVAEAANQSAMHSAAVVSNAETAMQRIEESSQQISNIIGVIDEIAFQTNLLALNAGVEAARAGDAGKGFAVVAQEVRELAQRSAQAAKEIKGLIHTSTAEVETGVKLVRDTGIALKTIVDYISQINRHMQSIATSAQEQSTGLSQVNVAVNEMDQTTQQNAAMVEQSTAAAASLSQEAAKLRDLVGQFTLEQAAAQAQMLRQAVSTMAGLPSRTQAATPNKTRSPKVVAGGNSAPTNGDWQEF